MKPHIRYSPVLRAWVVKHQPWPDAGLITTLRESWPKALALLGIATPEGWR